MQDEPTTIRPAAVPWFNNLASLISWSKTAIVDVERVHVSSTRYMRLIPRGPGMGRSGSGYSWDNGLASLPMGDSHGLWRRWCTYIVPTSRRHLAGIPPAPRWNHAGIPPTSRRYHATFLRDSAGMGAACPHVSIATQPSSIAALAIRPWTSPTL